MNKAGKAKSSTLSKRKIDPSRRRRQQGKLPIWILAVDRLKKIYIYALRIHIYILGLLQDYSLNLC